MYHIDGETFCEDKDCGERFHFETLDEISELKEEYYFYDAECHQDYISAFMKLGTKAVPEDYYPEPFEQFVEFKLNSKTDKENRGVMIVEEADKELFGVKIGFDEDPFG